MRRQAHAAGYSWRKWQDPIVYRPSRLFVGLFWATCLEAGAVAALVLFR
jgi:hypothetical protein